MSENANTPTSGSHPNNAEEPTDDGLWLVSYADDDDREMAARQIAAALDRGEIDSNTIVWRDGMPEWKPIAEVEPLKAQLRRCNLSPEALRRRQTVLGGFGPVRHEALPATSRMSALADTAENEDDEPTMVQPMFDSLQGAEGDVAEPPADSASRNRHTSAGNTLRIRTGEPPPVTPRTARSETPPTPFMATAVDSEDELDSLPSNVLVTAPNYTEVAPGAPAKRSGAPPPPTRGVMTRHSDPPTNGARVSSIPRATLTRDEESQPGGSEDNTASRHADVPKPPVPKRVTLLDDTGAPAALPSGQGGAPLLEDSGPISSDTPTPRATALPSTASARSGGAWSEREDLANQRTRPPRSRRGAHRATADERRLQPGEARSTSAAPPETPRTNGLLLALLGMGAAAALAFALGKNYGTAESQPSEQEQAPHQAQGLALADTTVPELGTTAAPTETAPNSAQEANQTADVPTEQVVERAPEAPAQAAQGAAPPTTPKPLSRPEEHKPAQRSASLSQRAPVTQSNPTPQAAAQAAAAAANPAGEADGQRVASPSNAETPSPANTATAADEASAEVQPFNSSAAATALGNAASRASACRKEGDPSGVARVTVTFANTGKATRAIVDGPPFAGTGTGGCIAETMRNATVPAFSGERVTVKKTVVIQ